MLRRRLGDQSTSVIRRRHDHPPRYMEIISCSWLVTPHVCCNVVSNIQFVRFGWCGLYSPSYRICNASAIRGKIYYADPCLDAFIFPFPQSTFSSPSSRLFPTKSHAERTSTLRPGYEPLGGDPVLGSRAVGCWSNGTEDFGLQMSNIPSRLARLRGSVMKATLRYLKVMSRVWDWISGGLP